MEFIKQEEYKDKFGIYCIINVISGDTYIGQTSEGFQRRYWHHRWKLRNNSHDNQHLQKAWNVYGENNFEFISKEELDRLLNEYEYQAITVTLTGDYPTIYQRFLERNESHTRHRGHVVNDCYPEKESGHKAAVLSYEDFVSGIQKRGMDQFVANGPQIIIDTTDFDKLDLDKSLNEINQLINGFTT